MKKLFIFVATATLMMSCSMLQGTSTGTSTSTTASTTTTSTTSTTSNSAVSAGQSAGTALLAIYNQYKADGKYNYTNANNILNSVALVAACADLKNSTKEYRSSFGQGLLLSAASLVNQNNVNTVTDQLVDMVSSNEKVNTAASTAQEKLATAASTASSISSLLSLFSGK